MVEPHLERLLERHDLARLQVRQPLGARPPAPPALLQGRVHPWAVVDALRTAANMLSICSWLLKSTAIHADGCIDKLCMLIRPWHYCKHVGQ
jgi:hypothetical protein